MHEWNTLEIQFHVEKLLADYCHCIDEDRLEEWPEFFVDQCLYKIVARENTDRNLPLATIMCDSKAMLKDRIVSLRNANIYEAHHYRHVVGSTIITKDRADSLFAKSNYAVYRTRTNGATDIFSVGAYHDKIVSHDGRLKFAEKIVIYDTDRIDTLLVTPL